MDSHPYWSYGPPEDSPVLDALAEGRRLTALTLAVGRLGPDASAYRVLQEAVEFEAFLKGEGSAVAVSRRTLARLEARSRLLARLEANGVDNWEGYSAPDGE